MSDRFVLRSQSLDLSRDVFPLTDATMTLGRSSKCDLVLNHPSISYQHAEIKVLGSALLISDLYSLAGCYFNNVRMSQFKCGVGDCVRFGEVNFVVAKDVAECEEYAASDRSLCRS